MNDLAIRPATDGDLPRLIQLLLDCVAQMRADGIDQWDEVYPTSEKLAADIRAGTLFVTAPLQSSDGSDGSDGDPVGGMFVLDEIQEPEYAAVPWTVRTTRVGVIHRLMVHPSRQGQGLGFALMRLAEARARDLGHEAIRLDAFAANLPSMRLYARLGYRDAGGVTFRKGPFRCFEKNLATDATA